MGSKTISVASLRAFKEYCNAAGAKPAVVDFTGMFWRAVRLREYVSKHGQSGLEAYNTELFASASCILSLSLHMTSR